MSFNSIRHLGLFSRPLLDIEEHGFCYKDKLYTHDDIKRIDISGGNGRALRVSVKLKDGELILVNVSAVELNGKKARTGFFACDNETFDALRKYFDETHT